MNSFFKQSASGPRKFTEEEIKFIEKEKKKLIPKIFYRRSDSPAVWMHSPTGGKVLGALSGGLGGAMFGLQPAMVAAAATQNPLLALGVLGVPTSLGATIGAYMGGHRVNQRNIDIEEALEHLSRNATIRDYYADPAIKNELEINAIDNLTPHD